MALRSPFNSRNRPVIGTSISLNQVLGHPRSPPAGRCAGRNRTTRARLNVSGAWCRRGGEVEHAKGDVAAKCSLSTTRDSGGRSAAPAHRLVPCHGSSWLITTPTRCWPAPSAAAAVGHESHRRPASDARSRRVDAPKHFHVVEMASNVPVAAARWNAERFPYRVWLCASASAVRALSRAEQMPSAPAPARTGFGDDSFSVSCEGPVIGWLTPSCGETRSSAWEIVSRCKGLAPQIVIKSIGPSE